jgi:hypothetical protein
MTAGGAVGAIGATGAIGVYIWVESGQHRRFFAPVGDISIGMLGLGLLLLLLGVVTPSADGAARQVQRGGPNSTNLQAGGDISVRNEPSDSH